MALPARKRTKDRFADLSDDSMRCRINGHVWRPYDARRVVGAFETEEVCERCESHRHSIIGNRGEVRTRRIVYAEHYLADGPLETDDRDALRLIVVKWDFGL